MARLEVRQSGIVVLVLSPGDLEDLKQRSRETFDMLCNSHAYVTGSLSPVSLRMVASWEKGFPFLTKTEDGGTEIEIGRSGLRELPTSSQIVDGLKLVPTFDDSLSVTISENAGTKRTALVEDVSPLTRKDLIAFLQDSPKPEHIVRLAFRQHDPDEIDDLMSDLRDERVVRFDGETYFLLFDQRIEVQPTTKRTAQTIMRALRADASSEKDIAELIQATNFDDEELDLALEAMVRQGRVFVYDGKFCLPEPERRRAVVSAVVDSLANTSTSLTLEEIMEACGLYHPAWVHRTVNDLVAKRKVLRDEDHYVLARSEPGRAVGINRMKQTIREATEAGKPLKVTELYATLTDLQPWLIRLNLTTLINSEKVVIDGDVIRWTNRRPGKEPKKQRDNIREMIAAYLNRVSDEGVRRDVILNHFTSLGFEKKRTSVALQEMCTQGRAKFRGGVYKAPRLPSTARVGS